MKLEKLEAKPNLSQLQKDVIEYWKKDGTFAKSLQNKTKGQIVFYDGPPFPTGNPHHGTILVSFIKDMVCRYFTMKGYSVPRDWGWDCHGLPIETKVEEAEGIKDKTEIEKSYGIAKFNNQCFKLVDENNDNWRVYIDNMGRWVDYDNPYRTMDKSFMESVMWTFKTCYDKGLIYKDYRVTPYCYRCETSLSMSDTRESDSTRPKQDRWVIARFKLDQSFKGKDTYMLAWTTTPWTLPSNMALAINLELNYAYVDLGDKVYIAGEDAISRYEKVFGSQPNIVCVVKGKELEGLTYEPVLPYFANKKEEGAFKVIGADYVDASEGLAVVHTAPAFGEDDYWACKANKVPLVNPVNEKGEFTQEVYDFAGKNVMQANGEIIKFLYNKEILCADGSIVHNYPHCWRCKTPLIYRGMKAWYLNIDKLKPNLLKHAESINWIPETVKEGRFGNWLKNARDWNISRNRYWGTPIPVWECDKCGDRDVLGSIEEIKEKSGIELNDLHRQFVDEVKYPCSCGGNKVRTPEILDCWFDSGSAPHARKHYPFENKEWIENNMPSDFVVEYTGQIRGWFYYLHVLSVALFDRPAYKNCIVHGTILAKDGKKLSKSSKNYTDPLELINMYGTDALRLYLYQSKAMILDDLQFDESGIQEQLKVVILPLWNAYNFFLSYASIDGYEVNEQIQPNSDNELDKWILALLYDVEKEISINMDKYQIDGYMQPIIRLVDGLTNWYIRRSRRRFYSSEMNSDKKNAYDTLYYVLLAIAKIIAPIAPFIAEHFYKHISTSKESVHLQKWCDVSETYQNKQLLCDIELVQNVIYLARVIREKNSIKNRQPLSSVYVSVTNREQYEIVQKYKSIILEEINVKNIEMVEDVSEIATINYKPNFSYIRANYPEIMGDINKCIMSGNYSLQDDCVIIKIAGNEKVLDKNVLLVEYVAKQGQHVLAENGVLVSLDTALTRELLNEGFAREIIRNIQDERKKMDCELIERIYIDFDGDYPKEYIEYICSETLSEVKEIENPSAVVEVSSQLGVATIKLARKQ